MKKAQIFAAATMGALVALGPATTAFADAGPIDWSGGKEDSPPVHKSSYPSKPSKPNQPSKPRVHITKTPKAPAKPVTPAKPRKSVRPAFKVDRPDAIGEAAFYGAGQPKIAVADGKVEAKGKPEQAPAAGKVEAKSTTPTTTITIKRQPPRQTVVRVPDKPTPAEKPRGGQLPIGAPRTGFGAAAGTGLDPLTMGAGGVAVLGGLALAGIGMARRRRVTAWTR